MFKKLMSCVLAIMMTFSMCISVSAATSDATENTTACESISPEINTRKIDLSEKISLSAGDTWKERFDTDRFLVSDHDAFRVKLTNVSGSFKVMILGGNGYFYESSTYTDTNVTFTTINAKADVQYTVSVINTSSDTKLTATVEIESFYNE